MAQIDKKDAINFITMPRFYGGIFLPKLAHKVDLPGILVFSGKVLDS